MLEELIEICGRSNFAKLIADYMLDPEGTEAKLKKIGYETKLNENIDTTTKEGKEKLIDNLVKYIEIYNETETA